MKHGFPNPDLIHNPFTPVWTAACDWRGLAVVGLLIGMVVFG